VIQVERKNKKNKNVRKIRVMIFKKVAISKFKVAGLEFMQTSLL